MKVEYPQNQIRMRHYGHLLEEAFATLEQTTDPVQQQALVQALAPRMRYCISTYKNDTPNNDMLAHDIEFYTHGVISKEVALNMLKD